LQKTNYQLNMKKLYMSAVLLYTTTILYAQDVVCQKNIKSSTQDFLSQVTTTIDQQSLIMVNFNQ
jgi:radical SAM superfamily enzyme with C-terminal helix-hairpin-helix motif